MNTNKLIKKVGGDFSAKVADPEGGVILNIDKDITFDVPKTGTYKIQAEGTVITATFHCYGSKPRTINKTSR